MRRRSPGRIWLAITVGLLVVVVVVVLAAQQSSPPAPASPLQNMTMDPRIIANLTQFPLATPLSGQSANDITALRQMVDACPDYDTARRGQVDEQLDFIINPAELPSSVIIALGTDPQTHLLVAVGTVTANQWQLAHKPAGSCLIPIGKRINELLIVAGVAPVPAFVDVSS